VLSIQLAFRANKVRRVVIARMRFERELEKRQAEDQKRLAERRARCGGPGNPWEDARRRQATAAGQPWPRLLPEPEPLSPHADRPDGRASVELSAAQRPGRSMSRSPSPRKAAADAAAARNTIAVIHHIAARGFGPDSTLVEGGRAPTRQRPPDGAQQLGRLPDEASQSGRSWTNLKRRSELGAGARARRLYQKSLSSDGALGMPEHLRVASVRSVLCSLYARHQPEKLERVDRLLDDWKGKEDVLLKQEQDRYTDPLPRHVAAVRR